MKIREDKKMVNLVFSFLFKNTFFENKLEKNQHIHFLVHGHSSWSTFDLYLVRAPKAL